MTANMQLRPAAARWESVAPSTAPRQHVFHADRPTRPHLRQESSLRGRIRATAGAFGRPAAGGNTMLRAFIFDFDGLILDTETPLIDAYAEVHAAHGVPFDRAAFLHSVGHADFTFDPWHGFSPHADRAALELERRTRKEKLMLRLQVLPGVVALLDAARAHRLRVGCASNSPHSWVDDHLARLGLLEHFEFIACRGDAPSPKPEPDLYNLVLNRFGLRGHQAVAFEDSHSGTVAAKRAHLWCVAAPNGSTAHHDFSRADWLVASLTEVSLDELGRRFR